MSKEDTSQQAAVMVSVGGIAGGAGCIAAAADDDDEGRLELPLREADVRGGREGVAVAAWVAAAGVVLLLVVGRDTGLEFLKMARGLLLGCGGAL